MDKLPPVSYIRMVDIWLITVQLLPFILVLILTATEIYVEPEHINHHGLERQKTFQVHYMKQLILLRNQNYYQRFFIQMF